MAKLVGKIIISGLMVFIFFSLNTPAQATRVNDLKNEINSYNIEIDKIEREIEEYKKTLNDIKDEYNTLQSEIKRIDITRQKLSADINLTQIKVNAVNLMIEKLDIEIDDNQKLIDRHRSSIAEAIRQINNADQETLVAIILANNSLIEFLNQSDSLIKFQDQLEKNLANLRQIQNILTDQKQARREENNQLQTLTERLVGQKVIADANRREQTILLAATQNKESNYKSLLAERLAKKEQLEQEIRRIEEAIRIEIDPSSLPQTGSGILKWPLKNIRITQYFGNTTFASRNPQIYSGQGHSGIDLAASVGTPVTAALAGRVTGIDDTDRVCPGASYGKWLIIDHGNGLSTLYAHLSYVLLTEGQLVDTGQEIAYTGNTGYTTGPHLHFEVLATQAIRITDGINELKSKSCAGAVYRLPLSSFNGKLNPLSYL